MVNKVFFLGNLGKAPELTFTPSGAEFCFLNLALSSRKKNKAGVYEPHTDWVTVKVWGKQAVNCEAYLAKGSKVHVEGRVETGRYQDKSGKDVYRVDFVADRVTFLTRANDQPQQPPQQQSAKKNTSTIADIIDDVEKFGPNEIPF